MGLRRPHKSEQGFWYARSRKQKKEQTRALEMLLDAKWNDEKFRFEKYDEGISMWTYFNRKGEQIGTEGDLNRLAKIATKVTGKSWSSVTNTVLNSVQMRGQNK